MKLIRTTLEQINAVAEMKLGFAVKIKNGYKLCDFKPTYGILFSEILKKYDFWGHGDIDVIFGKIRNFITDEILYNNDLISARHDSLTGQFLLFRNSHKMNTLFTLSKDYKKVLSSEQHYCFDETNFQRNEFTLGKSYNEISSEVESMTHLVKRLEKENYLRVYFDFLNIEGLPGKLKWVNGRLFYKGRYEILLYHLCLFKDVCRPIENTGKIPNRFSISATRIYQR